MATMGRPQFQPTDEHRKLVEQMAAFGIPLDQMVQMVSDRNGKPITVKTLRKHFKAELETGELKANTKVAQCLYKQATEGNVTAQIFWLKTRARWKESPQRVELTGKDGGPVEQKTTVVDEQQIKAAVSKLEDDY
jgi:hypothetical protein